MPELPEVEITRRSIAHHVQGARVLSLRLGKPLRWPLGIDPAALTGAQLGPVARRGKYLLLQLDAGVLLLHLGMSGSLQWLAQAAAPGAHDHFDLVTTRGTLRLHDPRRFGAVVWASALDDPVALKLLGHLGPEPWDEAGQPFDALTFWQSLRHSRAPIKQVLLQGRAVVGVGNIYASEALFRARIHPALAAQRISRARALALRDAVCEVLAQALDMGGSTLRDFSNAHGEQGLFQRHAQVYGREGLACVQCAQPVRRVVQGQRSTWWCPVCQRR